jgi:hypothetical protein
MRLPPLILLLLIPETARAQEVISGRVDTVLLATGSSIANVAGMIPAVGDGIGVAFDLPNQRWAIAGTVAGAAQLTFGLLSIASGLAQSGNDWLAGYGAATALLGAGNLVLGLINLFKSHRAHRRFALLDGVPPSQPSPLW